MDLKEAIRARHSVRSYQNRPLEAEVKEKLASFIEEVNGESGLHIQLVTDEPLAFDSRMAHYGNFKGVTNYIALIGKKTKDLEVKTGYYGEKIVLYAQTLGLNTCWVAMTYKKIKTAYAIDGGEKLNVVIAIGYGETEGKAHKIKTPQEVGLTDGAPTWFAEGVEMALLAPTAINQQKFRFERDGDKVRATAGKGFYVKTDLGIAKYHFEIGAGKDNFLWEEQ